MTLFLLILFAVSLLLLVYPFALYPLVLRLLPALPQNRETGPSPGTGAVLVCARNEAAALPELLARLEAARTAWPGLDVLVHDDASTDATPAILRGIPWITVLRSPRPVGKAAGLRRLAARTRAEILFLMDANALPHPAALPRLRDSFRDPDVGAAGASLLPLGGVGAGRIGQLYWRSEEALKRLETRSGSTIGCDGGLWAIRRHLYPHVADAESDDFRASVEPLLKGARVVFLPAARAEEIPVADAILPARSFRIACGAWHAHRAMAPRLRRLPAGLRFRYVSHKLVRWFAGLWLVLAALSGLGLAVLAGHLVPLAAASAVAMAAALAGIGPARSGLTVAAGFVGTTAGILAAMAGVARGAWAPVRPA